MAQEWYLLKSPHSQLSGYESDALNDFAEEGFLEALNSEIAVDVELCNYDLSDCKPIRAIIQNTVQDTKLKSLTRLLFVPIGTCKAGMYIKFKNRFWLITGLVDDNKFYEKAVMQICNYYLTWVNDDGYIVQRWANVTSASQYNNGETYTDNYKVRSDQLMILTPDDDECLLLYQGKRFIIDQRCKVYEKYFDETVEKCTSKPVIVYRLTRADSVLFDYQDSGCYEFMAYQDEQREQDGYYVIDGKGYWLCGDVKYGEPNRLLSCSIECESPEIYAGLDAVEFVARFFDADGEIATVDPVWNISCDFADSLVISYVDSAILISVDDPQLINKSFELSLSGTGYKPASITVKIKAFI